VIASTLVAWRSGNSDRVIARSVQALAERYDPTAVDPPLEARVRLTAGDEAHDALLDPAGMRIVATGGDRPGPSTASAAPRRRSCPRSRCWAARTA
jgi:hypothetical protein